MQSVSWGDLERVTWQHVALAVAVLALARLLSLILQSGLRRLAGRVSPLRRLAILRTVPVTRLAVGVAAVIVIVPIFVEPTFANAVAVLASVGLALAFALKDYASSLVAGLLIVLENVYQPGDWIEVGGIYGEVRSIDLRATRLVTADDTEVIIPNLRLWSMAVANATSGHRGLLCVAVFYLQADHDAAPVRARLAEVAESSSARLVDTPVSVLVTEKPWGTLYRLKAYVKDSREQFAFTTDLTIRGKAALRALGIRFARAPYAADGRD